ncbi:Zinc finger MYM-type protein 1 [Merluccius polli]|uniref:Zinc finger MYM-type protein 1 n=1 Tax=Merluccius polli TaxID=89951 RepID=A0AA47MJ08_MERPO|nr:Zinc finger MYM-type protein 1 [Merluccius polli]
MDISTQNQLVLVLRYIDDRNTVQERFFEFIPLQSANAEAIATALSERLAGILPDEQKGKLICQAYDGASVMRGATSGVQRRVQDEYPNAHYIHCYAHQLNLIMQQATSHISKVRSFFSDLGGFACFFSRSPKRTSVLDEQVAHRLPTSSNVRWNFHSRAVNTVFEHREDLVECFRRIRSSSGFDDKTNKEAGGYIRLLEDPDFNFFLQLFHHIMPHVDFLYAKLQKRNIDSVHINGCIQQFQKDIQNIRDSIEAMVVEQSSGSDQPRKRRALGEEDHSRIAAECAARVMSHDSSDFVLTCAPCEKLLTSMSEVRKRKQDSWEQAESTSTKITTTVKTNGNATGHTKERFAFTDHLISATLLQANRFGEYHNSFPEVALISTLKAYPMLNGSKLKTELSLIYGKEEFKSCCGAVDLFQLFVDNNLSESTAEAERCFSTLKRVKNFLRNTMTQDRLNALAILSMEKKLVNEMTDFNQKCYDPEVDILPHAHLHIELRQLLVSLGAGCPNLLTGGHVLGEVQHVPLD